MFSRESKDRFLYVGERILNAFVCAGYIAAGIGAFYLLVKNITGGKYDTISNLPALGLGLLVPILRAFSKWLEKKHIELKEIVYSADMLKGDAFAMAENAKDPNWIPVIVKRGSVNPMEELNSLIGLKNVKEDIEKMAAVYRFEENKYKGKKKKEKPLNQHYAFVGDPGTGKTTVARIFCGLLYELGRIKRNVYVECTGNDLISEFAGDTKNRIAKIYQKARNGLLFIDEAYVLEQTGERAPEAIAQLLTYMENDPDTVIIFAGYKKEMADFIAMNSGLASRIAKTIEFENYSPQELLTIFKIFARRRGMTVSDKALEVLKREFSQKIINCQKTGTPFSNGRYARNCFNAVYQTHAVLFTKNKDGSILENRICAQDVSETDILTIS